jgi:hypothetical protein
MQVVTVLRIVRNIPVEMGRAGRDVTLVKRPSQHNRSVSG